MNELFASSGIIDWILALVAVEAVALVIWRARTGGGPAPLPLVGNLLAGFFLLLALRSSLAGASGNWIAICLMAALVAHLADLAGRWDRGEPKRSAAGANNSKIAATISVRVQKSPSPSAKPNPSVKR